MLCPEVLMNLISVSQLPQCGGRAEFKSDGAILYHANGSVYLLAHHRFGLWFCIFVRDDTVAVEEDEVVHGFLPNTNRVRRSHARMAKGFQVSNTLPEKLKALLR